MNKDNISGFQNEKNFVKKLNCKRFCELLPNFQDMLIELYKDINYDDIIYCRNDYGKKKFDIVISINNVIKRISIKMGINNSVHTEGISGFINFLIDCKVPRQVILEYLQYHYADGTRNGKGINRMSSKAYKEKFQHRIDYINNVINKSYILERAINRFVLQGNNSLVKIDGIIYGTTSDFLFISSDDIFEILMSKSNVYSTGVHFGNLFVQPMTRNLNHNPKYEKRRYCVQIKWYSIFDDIIESKNNKVMKNVIL